MVKFFGILNDSIPTLWDRWDPVFYVLRLADPKWLNFLGVGPGGKTLG